MDELERAWVRNKAEEHYRRTRGVKTKSGWWKGLLVMFIGALGELKQWFID